MSAMNSLLLRKYRSPAPNINEPDLPLVVTKLELITEHPNHYRVTFNLIWRLINTYEQIEESAKNWSEIEYIILPIERKKKINQLLNIKNKIYTDRILFEKNNY